MNRRVWALVAIAAACSAHPCHESSDAPVHDDARSLDWKFSRFETSSSECPHGTAARSGRVTVEPRVYAGLAPVAPVDDGPMPEVPPRFVDIPAHYDGIVLERPGSYEGTYDVRTRAGGAVVARGGVSSIGAHVLARDEGYYLVGERIDWHDARPSDALGQGAELLAQAITGGALRTLVATPAAQTPDRPVRPDYTLAEARPLRDAQGAAQSGWAQTVRDPGVGAIDASGGTVMALSKGRFVVLLPQGGEGDAAGEGVSAVDVPIDPSATDLSIVPPFAMVLYGGGDAGLLATVRNREFAVSRLEARRGDGSLAWRTALTFLATQPPVDGGDRVYVIGAGIAAVDLSGRVLWSSPSGKRLRAQAFTDGTLAVVRGRMLEIVSGEGDVRQSFMAGEELTTYPAIDADGQVWVASAKTLYRTRS